MTNRYLIQFYGLSTIAAIAAAHYTNIWFAPLAFFVASAAQTIYKERIQRH